MCKKLQLTVPEPGAQQSIATPPGPPKQNKQERFREFWPQLARGSWCSGITPAQHAGGPGFNPQSYCCPLWWPSLALFCFCLLKDNKILDLGAAADTTMSLALVLWS